MNPLAQGLPLCVFPINIQKYCYFSHLKIKRYMFWPHFSLQLSLLCSPFFERLVYTHSFQLISFPSWTYHIQALPWCSINMVLINNINDVHALHLICPFSSIWRHSLGSFLSHSFHLTPRTPYVLGFPSPHWLLPHSLLLLVSDFLPPPEHLKTWFLDFSSVTPLEISSNLMFPISVLVISTFLA